MKTTPIQIALGVVLTLGSVRAQTYTILKSFGILTNVTGFGSESTLVQGADGTLYGTTSGGEGNVAGTVFKVQPDGSGFTVLKRFLPLPDGTFPDGAHPWAGLALAGSTLYGTTSSGGVGAGTIFKINTDGTGFAVLNNFTGGSPDGALPEAALTLSGGTLYGTTYYGGTADYGTVFKLNADGTGYAVLHSFIGSDGANPIAGLTLSGSTLYGTTFVGSTGDNGTVFKLNTDGTGYTVLKNFGGTDGANPYAGLTLSGSTLYGTTVHGGTANGTVFKLNTDGTGYAVLYNFPVSPDGPNPFGALTLSGSTLYGTTEWGGSSNAGTMFELNTDGTGYAILYNFTGSTDGNHPEAGLTLSGGTLYGTTLGTVFKLNTDGTGFSVLENFAYSDGADPAGLTLSGSTLYGTTEQGGSAGYGTVFKLNTDGKGYTVLYDFMNSLYPYSFVYPNPGLVLSDSTLYGTTQKGGSADYGTVFKLNTDGTGYTELWSFTDSPDGASPQAGLTLSGTTLYGTTAAGGDIFAGGQYFNSGTVFSINTDGTGYSVLYNFGAGANDGDVPTAGLTLSGSTLYGTTEYGGSGADGGTVFKLNTDGTGYTVLWNFTNYSTDGFNPQTGLALSGSTLYGTTAISGLAGNSGGTVFKLNTDGTGYTVLTNSSGDWYGGGSLVLSGSTLYLTTGGAVYKLNTDGTGFAWLNTPIISPAGVVALSGTTLYGTTAGGGDLGEGLVFSLNLAPVLNINSLPGRVVLTWADPAFSLQSAPEVSGAYTNVPSATSPYTNVITAGRQFFRLATP